MSERGPAGTVAERVEDVIRLLDLLETAADHPDGTDDGRADLVLDRLRGLVTHQRDHLTARRDEVDTREATEAAAAGPAGRTDRTRDRPSSSAAVLQQVTGALAEAMSGYVRLYTTARLLFDATTCDIAADHLRTLGETLQVINWLLPDVVGRSLQELDGLDCRCRCPACSIGACLCVRNSTDTVLHAVGDRRPFGTSGLPDRDDPDEVLERWSLAGLAPDRGVALRTTPRRGSPLAEAGIDRGDRITEVDGVEVRSNPEIQNALSARDVGEEVRLGLERASGEVTEIRVRRPTP